MRKFSNAYLAFITLIIYFGIIKATLHINNNNNNANDDYKSVFTAFPLTHHIETNMAANSNSKIQQNTHHLHHNNWRLYKTSKALTDQHTPIVFGPYTATQLTNNAPAKHSRVDHHTTVDVMLKKRFIPQNDSLQQPVKNIHDFKQREEQLFWQQIQKQQLSKAYTDFTYEPYQHDTAPKEAAKVSSNDHLTTRNLAAYVTPAPMHLEIHPYLHHSKKHAIVSHAIGSEPSPMTTMSIKSLATMENMPQFATVVNGVKYFLNKLNDYDNLAERVTELKKPTVNTEVSKQYTYAPRRPFIERELSYSKHTLPYPPSFITITTTEKPILNSKPIYHKMPDLFMQRQSKSLWDSYIPSWQITRMLQQFKNNNNLHTLAYPKRYKNEIKK